MYPEYSAPLVHPEYLAFWIHPAYPAMLMSLDFPAPQAFPAPLLPEATASSFGCVFCRRRNEFLPVKSGDNPGFDIFVFLAACRSNRTFPGGGKNECKVSKTLGEVI